MPVRDDEDPSAARSGDGSSGTGAPMAGSSGRSRSTVIRVVFLLAVVAFAAWAIVKERHSLAQAWDKVELLPVLVALLLSIVGAFSGFPQWRVLLAGLGSDIRMRPASKIFFIGQLGKYIPGGVWNIVAQATMARELKVPRARTGAAGLLAIVVALPVVGAMAAVTLAISGREVLGAYWWTLLLVVPLLAFLQPDVLVRLAAFAARITRRSIPLERVPGRNIAEATAWTAFGQIISGLSLMFLVAMFTGSYPSPLLCIGIYSLGLLAGMLVVLAPAGAGAREAVIALGLSPYMEHGAALLVALLARVLTIGADATLAGAAALVGQRAPSAPGGVGAASAGERG
ncbi:lysylphosphatidylglycerol synthase domain-containing protein [Nakamurella sp. PAMC28650]|uniref:lysylphosphatidylglycerol synthase domain-containing protein n=1 Tax=Nakamurella sp. PAMC28650 TaxID=2762325 RepID=UPI0021066FC3|nr:lysylphosphatidylglycerol synthase domain-containing protein [Nakamurella sp. PAMC28650]